MPERMRLDVYGRTVSVDVGAEIDECGQFRVAILVDGKERWAAHFTDRSEQVEPPGRSMVWYRDFESGSVPPTGETES